MRILEDNLFIQGIGTARPYADISFGNPTQKLYQGRCQIVLRAGDRKGNAEVMVSGSENVVYNIKVI